MSDTTCLVLKVNAIVLHVHSAGPQDGPPIWLLHGFPECWHSWREQIAPLAAAGYRVLVPEMRGYGNSSAPEDVAAYSLLTLCADIQQAMDALGQQQACIVGHDWGAVVAWHLALLEPQRVTALVTLSVPFAGRPKRPAVEIMRELFSDRFNYILYFQQAGVAEQELDADIAASLLHFMHDSERLLDNKSPDARLFDGLPSHRAPPDWCPPADFQPYLATFARHGFRGALNWYRNFERNWQQTAPLAGLKVTQPTLFMLGDRDPVGQLEAVTLQRMPNSVPLLEQHQLKDCGHWVQSEKASQVNALLLAFVRRHYPVAGWPRAWGSYTARLKRQVGQFVHARQTLANRLGAHPGACHDADNRRPRLRPDLPHTQVGDAGIAISLHQVTDLGRHLYIGAVEQHRCAGLHQAVGPARDNQRTGMGDHVKAISEQGHRAGQVTGGNFAKHHDEDQRHHPQGAAGAFIMGGTEELVIVAEAGNLRERIHGDTCLQE